MKYCRCFFTVLLFSSILMACSDFEFLKNSIWDTLNPGENATTSSNDEGTTDSSPEGTPETPEDFFVAVGGVGTVLRSFDWGITWTPASKSNTSDDLHAVTSDGTVLVAVGNKTTIIFSEDGDTWQQTHKKTDNKHLWDVSYDGNNRFYAVGSSGLFLSTPDVSVIGPWDTDSAGTRFLGSIHVWEGSRLVGGYRTLLIHQDGGWSGVAWDFNFTGSVRDIARSTNLIIAVGASRMIATSADEGLLWNSRKRDPVTSSLYSPEDLQGVAAYGKKVIAVGDSGTILYSSDEGVSWVNRSSNPATGALYTINDLHEIATDGINWVVVGKSGTVLTSNDAGATWTVRNSGTSADLYGLSFFRR